MQPGAGNPRDAHGYPAGVLPTRLPATPDGAKRASVQPNAGDQPGRSRYPDAIRALIAGEAQTPLSERRRPAADWHVAPDEHEIDFLAPVPAPGTTNSAIGAHQGKSPRGGLLHTLAWPLLTLIRLPVLLAQAISPPQARDMDDARPQDVPASYPQPRWDTSPIEVTPVRYDPQAADRAAWLLDQRQSAQSQAHPAAYDSADARTPRGQMIARATPASILPPAEVDAATPNQPADEPTDDTPLSWQNLPEIEADGPGEEVMSMPPHSAEPVGGLARRGEGEHDQPQPNTVVGAARGLRRRVVGTLSALFTVARWTPRILWCCTFGLVKAGWDILSEAAKTSHAPTPRRGKVSAETPKPAEAKRIAIAATPPQTVVVSAPYKPAVSAAFQSARPLANQQPSASATPKPQADAPRESRPAAQAPRSIPPTELATQASDPAPTPKRDPLEPPPVPPIPQLNRDVTDEIAAARRTGPIAVGPSSIRPVLPIGPDDDHPATPGFAAGFFGAGLGNLLIIVLGATLCFAAGFGLSMADKDAMVMLGVLMMIAGVGGALLGVMLLNEWISALRFQLVLPLRLFVRLMGVGAALCLLVAFAAVTIPREHWPI